MRRQPRPQPHDRAPVIDGCTADKGVLRVDATYQKAAEFN